MYVQYFYFKIIFKQVYKRAHVLRLQLGYEVGECQRKGPERQCCNSGGCGGAQISQSKAKRVDGHTGNLHSWGAYYGPGSSKHCINRNSENL